MYGNGMVMQHSRSTTLWGYAAPDAAVAVTAAGGAYHGVSLTATTSSAGRWQVALPPVLPSMSPSAITATATATGERVVLGNVLAVHSPMLHWRA